MELLFLNINEGIRPRPSFDWILPLRNIIFKILGSIIFMIDPQIFLFMKKTLWSFLTDGVQLPQAVEG